MRTITIDNLIKTKMSDLFESVLFDLKRVKDNGVDIDMNHWVNANDFNKKCTVCLGAAAVCGFIPDINRQSLNQIEDNILGERGGKVDGTSFTKNEAVLLSNMMEMFNYFRSASIWSTIDVFNRFSYTVISTETQRLIVTTYKQSFFKGKQNNLNPLKKKITEFVSVLRKHNC